MLTRCDYCGRHDWTPISSVEWDPDIALDLVEFYFTLSDSVPPDVMDELEVYRCSCGVLGAAVEGPSGDFDELLNMLR